MFCKHKKQKNLLALPGNLHKVLLPKYQTLNSKWSLAQGILGFSLKSQRKIQDYMKDMRFVISNVVLQRTVETERTNIMGKASNWWKGLNVNPFFYCFWEEAWWYFLPACFAPELPLLGLTAFLLKVPQPHFTHWYKADTCSSLYTSPRALLPTEHTLAIAKPPRAFQFTLASKGTPIDRVADMHGIWSLFTISYECCLIKLLLWS